MRKLNSKFNTSFISEEGTYLQNKDYFAFVELDNFACYVICDGIDEDDEIQTAKIAVTAFIKLFTDKPTMNKYTIRRYLNIVNEEVVNAGRNTRLKASMTIAITNYKKVRYVVIGNSRFYYYKDGYLKIKSRDLSLTSDFLDDDMISKDKADRHIERNNLSCYLGQNKLSSPFISKKIKLNNGDAIALLTRGIWENCDENEIEECLEEAKEPQEVVDRVEDLILSKSHKELENYTLAVTFIEKTYINPKKKALIKKIILAAIPILLIVIVAFATFYIMHKKKLKNIDSMNNSISQGEKYIKNNNMEKASTKYDEALKIADKYNLKDKSKELNNEIEYLDLINDGDTKLEGKKYDEALEAYILANKKNADVETEASDYINKKIDLAKTCINVQDLLTLADSQLEAGKEFQAEANYLEAKRLAANYYLKDEKQQAINKLKEIYDAQGKAEEEQKEAQKQAEEKKEKEKEEEEKEEEEKDEALNKAIDLNKQADEAYISGDYVSAKMYYALAKDAYEKAGSISKSNEFIKKIEIMDKLIEVNSNLKAEGDIYFNQASSRYVKGDIESAKVLYSLAKDIYTSLKLTEEANAVEEKLKLIEEELAASNANSGDENG